MIRFLNFRFRPYLFGLLTLLLISVSYPATSQERDRGNLNKMMLNHIEKVDKLSDKLKVPEFQSGKDWFNSPPLRLGNELKGKVVVLDFWTYCCINCIHVLPDLFELEKKYAGYPVAFVGVHSAKFENEKVSENIRNAVLRYEIEHPVINDDEMFTWRSIGVRAWPSMAVLGPKGNMLLMVSGEGNKEVIDAAIQATLKFYPPELFRHDPIPIQLERDKMIENDAPSSPLKFPAKLASDPESGRLFISDSNHNRIVVTSLDGTFIESIGNGRIGLVDGDFDQARFNRPQGLAWHREKLYVADAENHALRVIDFKSKSVTTLAGNGKQGRDYSGGKSGAEQLISTPWAVYGLDDRIYIAMAGTHQIWYWDLVKEVALNFSGDGSEQNLNTEEAAKVAWAQPSGLAYIKPHLYIADSESSTIRGLNVETKAAIAIVGGDSNEPRNLFSFGDVDSTGDEAKLQHPLGVLTLPDNKSLLVADTYNHKIKVVVPGERKATSLAGTGTAGYKDGAFASAQFSEPSGFCYSDKPGVYFVADTNNHVIRVLNTENKSVSTLTLSGVPEALEPYEHGQWSLSGFKTYSTQTVNLKIARPTKDNMVSIPVSFVLPQGQKINDLAQSIWQVKNVNDDEAGTTPRVSDLFKRVKGEIDPKAGQISLELKPTDIENMEFHIEAVVYHCGTEDAEDTVCKVGHIEKKIKVSFAGPEDPNAQSILTLGVSDMTPIIHAQTVFPQQQ